MFAFPYVKGAIRFGRPALCSRTKSFDAHPRSLYGRDLLAAAILSEYCDGKRALV